MPRTSMTSTSTDKLRLDMRRHVPLIRFEQRHVGLRDAEPAGEIMLSPPFGLAGAAYVGAGRVDVSVEVRVIEDLIEYPRFDAERHHPITREPGAARLFFVKGNDAHPNGVQHILNRTILERSLPRQTPRSVAGPSGTQKSS